MHDIAIPAWARERGRLAQHFDKIDVQRSALLAIDLQKAFTEHGQVFGNPYARDILPAVNDLADALRAAGGLVVWTRQTVDDHGERALPDWHYDLSAPSVIKARANLRAGADGHGLNPTCAVHPADLVIDKYRYSPFVHGASDLDERLRAIGIHTLIIAGTLTNCCCESAARDASQRGYRVFFASDATAAVTDEEHNAALLNLTLFFADVRPTGELLELIAQAG